MLLIWFYVVHYSVKFSPFLFMEDSGNTSSFSRFTSCEKKVKSQVFWFSLFSMSWRKRDRLSQSRLGYKLVLLVLLFAYLLFLFFYLIIIIFLTSTVFTRGNWCWRHDNGRSFLPREKLWLRLRKSCTSNKLFNLDLAFFTYLFAYFFIYFLWRSQSFPEETDVGYMMMK